MSHIPDKNVSTDWRAPSPARQPVVKGKAQEERINSLEYDSQLGFPQSILSHDLLHCTLSHDLEPVWGPCRYPFLVGPHIFANSEPYLQILVREPARNGACIAELVGCMLSGPFREIVSNTRIMHAALVRCMRSGLRWWIYKLICMHGICIGSAFSGDMHIDARTY